MGNETIINPERIEPHENVKADSYYRQLVDGDEREETPQKGDLIYVTHINVEGVHFIFAKADSSYWTETVEDFQRDYEYAPEGREERQKAITDIMDEIAASQKKTTEDQLQFENFNLYISNSGDVVEESQSRDLISTDSVNSPDAMKKQIGKVRNEMMRKRTYIERKSKELRLLLSEQERALTIKMENLQKMVAKAQEVIWTINLYLGKDEEIVRIVKGEPAPVEEKIHIRQLVLFMDEESTIASGEGWMDFRDIEKFDEWLLDESHRNQVIPEQRAIVALQVCRKNRKYGDPWADQAYNDENKKTYFLMRNGENLYRIHTELGVGKNMFPLADEFEELFYSDWFIDRDKPKEEKRFKPGSHEYMRAMKSADQKQKHYMRVLLFLQGILDRTPVFHPLSTQRVNVMDNRTNSEYMTYIHDAEKLLSDGRPTYENWIKEVNSNLCIGTRVIGAFKTYGSDYQTNPDHQTPKENKVYVIERKDKCNYIFLFEREDEIWDRYGSHKPTRRASCYIDKGSKYILAFDYAEVEDMEHYINNRTDRHNYMDMIPLMRVAIETKKKEKKEEEPFRILLASEIHKKHNVSIEESSKSVSELVFWWKFKNKTHRSLTSDDSKALRMIVKEFGAKAEREEIRASDMPIHIGFVDKMNNEFEEIMYCGHKTGHEYVAFIPEDEFNVFARKVTYKYMKSIKEYLLQSDVRWTDIGNLNMNWKELCSTSCWADWKFDVDRSKFLSEPEYTCLRSHLLNNVKGTIKDDRRYEEFSFGGYSVKYKGEKVCKILAITLDENDGVYAFVWVNRFFTPSDNKILTNSPQEPRILTVKAEYVRNKKGVMPTSLRVQSYESHEKSIAPWEPEEDATRYKKVLWRDEKAIAEFKEDNKAFELIKKDIKYTDTRFESLCSLIQDYASDKRIEKDHQEFIEEFGDEDLWEEHFSKKERNAYNQHFGDYIFIDYLNILIDNKINIEGLSINEIKKIAIKLGVTAKHEDLEIDTIGDFVVDMGKVEEEIEKRKN